VALPATYRCRIITFAGSDARVIAPPRPPTRALLAMESSIAGNGALTGDRPEDAAYRDLVVTWQQRVAAAIKARDISAMPES
jgi:hypothetical protein